MITAIRTAALALLVLACGAPLAAQAPLPPSGPPPLHLPLPVEGDPMRDAATLLELERRLALLQPEPEQQEEFVPLDELPPEDRLAAAPLLVGAYAVVLVALFLYLFLVARRLAGIRKDMDRLEAELTQRGGV